MIIINGENATLGRLASFAAKEALKAEKVIILNCSKILITGSRLNILEEFEATRKRVGTTQKGPKISRTASKITKKTIRGMIPNYRAGRGKQALERIFCYDGVPSEYEKTKAIVFEKPNTTKYISIERLIKNER